MKIVEKKKKQKEHLKLIRDSRSEDVVELCKSAFEYLTNGPNNKRYELIASKYGANATLVRQTVESLISMLIDATKAHAGEHELATLKDEGFSEEVIAVLSQFVTSKKAFIEGSIKSAYIRAYRLVNLEWRLEVRVASRALLRQSNVFITMKMYLHMEPKKENRDLINSSSNEPIHSDDKRNRRDLLVQTDLNSLVHIISVLEDALIESKSRRIKNIIDAIH